MARPLLDPETQALWKLGYIQWVDFLFVGVLVLHLLTTFFWWVFGHPSAVGILVCAVAALGWLQLWIVLLIFRAARFVLDILAEIKLLPETSSKLAIQFMQQTGAR